MAKAEKNEEEREEQRKREGLSIFCQGVDLESCGDSFLGRTLGGVREAGLIVNLICVRVCVWCLM